MKMGALWSSVDYSVTAIMLSWVFNRRVRVINLARRGGDR